MPSLSYVVCSESAIELNTNTRKRETNRKFNVKHIILVEKRETEVISNAHQNIITEFRNSLATRRRRRSRKKTPQIIPFKFPRRCEKEKPYNCGIEANSSNTYVYHIHTSAHTFQIINKIFRLYFGFFCFCCKMYDDDEKCGTFSTHMVRINIYAQRTAYSANICVWYIYVWYGSFSFCLCHFLFSSFSVLFYAFKHMYVIKPCCYLL